MDEQDEKPEVETVNGKAPSRPRLFLSYARDDDEPFVRRLYDDLRARGFTVWSDRESLRTRQLTFHQEIKDAIRTQVDRLVMVVGPRAAVSDYVREEWQFALALDLPVVPVLRLGDFDLIPGALALLHCDDFRKDDEYATSLDKLVTNLELPEPPLGALHAVPSLPEHFLARPEYLLRIKDALLVDLQGPRVLTGAGSRVGVQGMGGIGKSVLATAVARDRQVRRAYPDGVLWVSLGQEPNLLQRQRELAFELGYQEADDGLLDSETRARSALQTLLVERAVLLVIDDVWDAGHVLSFDVLGPRSRALITTRDAGILQTVGGEQYSIALFSEAESMQLLADATGVMRQALAEEAKQVVRRCGCLPLALALCAGMTRKRKGDWSSVLARLKRADLQKIRDRQATNPDHESIWRAMQVSVDVLEDEAQPRFAELSVFATDRNVPEAAVATLWAHTGGLDDLDSEDLLIELAERSLIRLETAEATGDGPPQRRVSLHDLLHDYAVRIGPEPAKLHGAILDAYRGKCTDGWASGPDDGYFFQHLRRHLIESGRSDELVSLLLDLKWLEGKNGRGLTFDLLLDFEDAQSAVRRDHPKRHFLPLLAQALRRDIHFIWRHHIDYPQALFQSLWNMCWWYDCPAAGLHYDLPEHDRGQNPAPWGRSGAKLYRLLEAWHQSKRSLAPRFQWIRSLRPPAHSLSTGIVVNLRPERGHVTDVAFLLDEQHLVTSCTDSTLRIWEIRNGLETMTLTGHVARVNALALSPNGSQVVSASDDATVRLWDIQQGLQLASFEGHVGSVNCVAFFPDSQRVASGGEDGTLRIWGLKDYRLQHCYEGHTSPVSSVDVSPDGCYVATGSKWLNPHSYSPTHGVEPLVKVWRLPENEVFRAFRGHSQNVTAVLFSSDGQTLYSASFDETIRGWCIATGEQITHSHEWKHGGGLGRLTCLKWRQGKECLVVSYNDGRYSPLIKIIDVEGYVYGDHIELRSDVTKFAISTSGRLIAAVTSQGIEVVDLDRHVGSAKCRTVAPGCHTIRFSKDGHHICWDRDVYGVGRFGIGAWSLSTWKERDIDDSEVCSGSGQNEHYKLVSRQDETAFKCIVSDRVVAWYPVVLEDASQHPSGKIWAQRRSNYIDVIALESGDADRLMTGETLARTS